MNKVGDKDARYYFSLQILSKGNEKIKLSEGETTIGRSPINNIVIDDRFNLVSREHATIKLIKGRCFYLDHPKSRNGSYILDPKHNKITNTEDKWIRITRNSPYPVTQDTVIRLGGPFSILEEGQEVCDIKIIAEEVPRKKTTISHPKTKE